MGGIVVGVDSFPPVFFCIFFFIERFKLIPVELPEEHIKFKDEIADLPGYLRFPGMLYGFCPPF